MSADIETEVLQPGRGPAESSPLHAGPTDRSTGTGKVIFAIAVVFSLFQVYTASFTPLSSLVVRSLHVGFLRRMVPLVRLGDYVFVHAGIRPRVPLEEQSERDLRWIRRDFLDSRVDHGVMVVHGHTVSDKVDVRRNRIGVDTGAYASNRLSVLGLEADRRWVLTSRLG